MTAADGEAVPMEMDQATNERLINEEYKIWKKNTPYLSVAPQRYWAAKREGEREQRKEERPEKQGASAAPRERRMKKAGQFFFFCNGRNGRFNPLTLFVVVLTGLC